MNRDIARLRETIKILVPMLADRIKGLKVTQQGMEAFVLADKVTNIPYRVNIPFIPDTASDDLIAAIQGFIDHEVGHILFSDFSYASKATAISKRCHFFANAIEDPFVEKSMQRKFPGSVTNVNLLQEFYIDRITKPAVEQARKNNDDNELFGYILVPLIRAVSGQQVFDDYLRNEGMYQLPQVQDFLNLIDDLKPAIASVSSTRESFELAQEIVKRIEDQQKKQEEEQKKQQEQMQSDCDCDSPSNGDSEEEKEENQPSEPSDDDGDDEDGEADDEDSAGGQGDEEEENEDEQEGNASQNEKDEQEDDGDGRRSSDKEEDEENGEDDAGSDERGDGDPADEDGSDDDAGEDLDDEEDSDEGEEEDASQGAGDEDQDDNGQDEDGDQEETDQSDGEGEFDPNAEENEIVDDRTEVKETLGGEMEEAGSASNWGEVNWEMAEFDGAITKMIGDQACEDMQEADYLPFTTDFDVCQPYPISTYYKDAWLTKLEDDTSHMSGPLQKDIERMMAARSRVVQVPGYRSGRLHSAGLHRLATGDPRVFRRKEEHRSLETAVTLLIDNSGSMMGQPMHTAMAAGYTLAQTLERVGIACETIGFTTSGSSRLPVDYNDIRAQQKRLGRPFSRTDILVHHIFKDFNERLTPDVKKRFADARENQAGMVTNVDGESVQFAAYRLLPRSEKRKIMIVLSDGFPCGGRVAQKHLRDTVKKCSDLGIDMVGIGIDSDAVQQFYPQYFVLSNVNDLPGLIMSEMKRILMSGVARAA